MEPALAHRLAARAPHRPRRRHGRHPPDPEAGFRNFDDRTAQWLYAQCINYSRLQPGQQDLLTLLGITKPVAGIAAPDPATRHPAMETGLHYAQAWAAEHGALDLPRTARHFGFPLGWWLYKQRRAAADHLKRTGKPWLHEARLATLAPW